MFSVTRALEYVCCFLQKNIKGTSCFKRVYCDKQTIFLKVTFLRFRVFKSRSQEIVTFPPLKNIQERHSACVYRPSSPELIESLFIVFENVWKLTVIILNIFYDKINIFIENA